MSDFDGAFISISGVQVTADLLRTLSARIADASPMEAVFRASFLAVETERFDAEGPGWAALAPSTLAEKTRKGQPADILVATGKLKASLTQEEAEGAVFIPTFGALEASVTMGTELKPAKPGKGWESYALATFHQMGTSRMPSRPVIDDAPILAAEWTASLALWLSTGALPV
jgi:hypothetical protein